jgi:hypothetical protein
MTSRASPRCDFRLDLPVASRTCSKRSLRVAELDAKGENVNACALDEVLRRDRLLLLEKVDRSFVP